MDISVGSAQQITPNINKSNYTLPKDVNTIHHYVLPKDVNTINPTVPDGFAPFNQDIDVGKRKKYKCIRPPKLIQIDKTLTKQNYAADAATVGALINDLNEELLDVDAQLQLILERIGDVNVVELKEQVDNLIIDLETNYLTAEQVDNLIDEKISNIRIINNNDLW